MEHQLDSIYLSHFHLLSFQVLLLTAKVRCSRCNFYREGKGEHRLYSHDVEGKKRVVPIDTGAAELSPPSVLQIF